MKNTVLLITIICSILFFSCQSKTSKIEIDPFSHISEGKAKVLLQKGIAAAGGIDNWRKIASLQFKKDYQLFLEDGTVEKGAKQFHEYHFPSKKIKIESQEGESQKDLIFENGKAIQKIDGKLNEAAKQAPLMNSIYTSTFVIEIPFKFLDQGAEISYEGLDTLATGEAVEVLRVDYHPKKHNNLTTEDIWWLYFDQKDHRLHGYMVRHKDHISYVKNLTTTAVKGFIFPTHRKSYRVDADRNILYVRAEYFYKDYVIEML